MAEFLQHDQSMDPEHLIFLKKRRNVPKDNDIVVHHRVQSEEAAEEIVLSVGILCYRWRRTVVSRRICRRSLRRVLRIAVESGSSIIQSWWRRLKKIIIYNQFIH